MRKEVDAVTKLYDFILWVIPKLDKFPRSQKFVLGDRIESLLLDILELLIDAAYSRKKAPLLRSANLKLEKLRYLMRLSKDLKLLNMKGRLGRALSKSRLCSCVGIAERNISPLRPGW
jgi:hypothetical protein